jgi:predicted signal transduction protein with EAL and GGDEF domain
MSAAVAILDGSGSILAVNKAWSEAKGCLMFGEHHQTGFDYLESCRCAPLPWRTAGLLIREAIEGVLDARGSARFEYCSSDQTDPFWYSASITRFLDHEQIRIVVTHEDVTQLRRAEKRIIHLAYYDALTRLPNRYFVNEHLHYLIEHAKRHGQTVAILALDLDDLALLNTSLGYQAGDQLLCTVANRLKGCLRSSDCLARDTTPMEHLIASGNLDAFVRLEGDEFLLVLADICSYQDAEAVAIRIQNQFKEPFVLEGTETFVSVSIGISLFPQDAADANGLVETAEAALHYTKKNGKQSYSFYSKEISILSAKRLSMEARLRNAVERQQFELHYQPRIDLVVGRLHGIEALVRLADRPFGKTSPSEFISVAEETGLIIPMTTWILKTACRQCRAWQLDLLESLKVSVNISARHFRSGNLLEGVSTAIEASGIAPHDLELEITEAVLLDDFEGCARMLSQLKEVGVSIALDDFGTGYSSLSYLNRLPIDTIKIDRSFLTELPGDLENRAVVTAIIAVAKSLHLRIVAEGVEKEGQLNLLRELGCDEVQGFYFSPPVEAAQFPSLVHQLSTLLQRQPMVSQSGAASQKHIVWNDTGS